jgi:uncharacterized protein (DUF427 family)
MFRAVWKGVVLAESDETIVVEGNHYFPPGSIRTEYFRPSDHHTRCSWKGQASYYTLLVDGAENRAAAWYYPDPLPAADHIRGRVAFWRGVKVERVHPEAEGDDGPASTTSPRWSRLRQIFTP